MASFHLYKYVEINDCLQLESFGEIGMKENFVNLIGLCSRIKSKYHTPWQNLGFIKESIPRMPVYFFHLFFFSTLQEGSSSKSEEYILQSKLPMILIRTGSFLVLLFGNMEFLDRSVSQFYLETSHYITTMIFEKNAIFQSLEFIQKIMLSLS